MRLTAQKAIIRRFAGRHEKHAVSGSYRRIALLAAAFPAGSVTGAPKIRAMQIIDELEACSRGPYCGSIGWIGDDGRACLNVAIRTACIRGESGNGGRGEFTDGELSYSVGAGIVAESVPRREWEETMAKAGVLVGLRGRCGA